MKARKKTKTEAQLRDEMQRARDLLSEIENKRKIEANTALIGRAFRYRNCYSCPKDEADYWWLYAIVDKLDEYGEPIGWSFQRDSDGKISIETGQRVRVGLGNWLPIEVSDFYGAYQVIVQSLVAMQSREFKARL